MSATAITVLSARGELRHAALALLHNRLPPGEHEGHRGELLDAVESGDLPLDGLLLATVSGEPAGALLFVEQPGRAGFVWPPVSRPATDHRAIADALLQAANRQMDSLGVLFGQCILDGDDTEARSVLLENGYDQIVELRFLSRALDQPLPAPSRLLDWVPFAESQRSRFEQVIGQTYIGTQDCPALCAARSPADALRAHRGNVAFDPSLWRIYRSGAEDVGVLLLGELTDRNGWEIVYLGVTPAARGRGIGRMMLEAGLHQAQHAGCRRMHLVVDGANGYAIRLYEQLGFVGQERRIACLRLRPGI